MIIVGASALAEICAICALERGIRIIAIIDPKTSTDCMLGVPVHRDLAAIIHPFDGAVIADLEDPARALASAQATLGADRILIPPFLRTGLPRQEAA
jgi:hypothetical protein